MLVGALSRSWFVTMVVAWQLQIQFNLKFRLAGRLRPIIMLVSPTFARGFAATAYATLGMLAGFYVQHAYSARASAAFEAGVDAAVADALRAREARVAALEAEAAAAAARAGPRARG